MLNKQKGNMYAFVTHTWNPIVGRCSHDCVYCFMKRWGELKPIRLDNKQLKTNLGQDNFIFVGSSTDIFAMDVPAPWIIEVLEQCRKFEGNTYLFQTKHPARFWNFNLRYPRNTIFGTTLETNRDMKDISNAESAKARVSNMKEWFMKRKMVTIEPILDFDLEEFVAMIKEIGPEWVNIGADSKGHGLKEPSADKILALIQELEKFTQVRKKSNLDRLLKK